MNNEGVTYAELNLGKKSKGQQEKAKGTKVRVPVSQEDVTYADLHLRGAPQGPPGSDGHRPRTGSAAPPEKLVAGLLGLLCLVLMCGIIGAVMVNPSTAGLKNDTSPLTTTATFPSADHCGPCPQEWFSYSGSCYYLSDERTTWSESVEACAAKNASLLLIEHEEEMRFLKSISLASWVGVSRQSCQHPWMPSDGPIYTEIITSTSNCNANCVMLTSSGPRADPCDQQSLYCCKRRL